MRQLKITKQVTIHTSTTHYTPILAHYTLYTEHCTHNYALCTLLISHFSQHNTCQTLYSVALHSTRCRALYLTQQAFRRGTCPEFCSCTALHCTILHCIVLNCTTVLYCAVLYCTLVYFTHRHSSVHHFFSHCSLMYFSPSY